MTNDKAEEMVLILANARIAFWLIAIWLGAIYIKMPRGKS